MSLGLGVGDFIAIIQNVSSIVAALSSTAIVGWYEPHHSTAAGRRNADRSEFVRLSKGLDLVMRSVAEISETERGRDSRLRVAIGSALEPMRSLQEELEAAELLKQKSRLEELGRILSLPKPHLPQAVNDPPPLLFLGACILYTLAMASLRNRHKADRFQDRILAVGCAVGVAGAMVSRDPFLELKKYLAWSMFLALVLSALFHRLLRLRLDPDVPGRGGGGVGDIEKEKQGVGASERRSVGAYQQGRSVGR